MSLVRDWTLLQETICGMLSSVPRKTVLLFLQVIFVSSIINYHFIAIRTTTNDFPNGFVSAHSMEEAEVLCDRLGIFVDGSFQCLGNPKEVCTFWSYFLFLLSYYV